MSLLDRVLATIRKHAQMRTGDRVLVAVSGGSDSVALLRILDELQRAGELTIAGVAHLNHGLRDSANTDEAFCRALAERLQLPFRCDLIDVRGLAGRLGTSLEDAGRRARYDLFARVADELSADVIATGHTRDDQAETFLLRLIRGAGARGLGGIHPKAGTVVRPLIDVTRDELQGYLTSIDQPYCEDETNRDLSIPRNRVRHELLPYVRREFSPAITDVLAREATIARQDEGRLQEDAIEIANSIVLSNVRPGSVRLQPDEAGRVRLQPDHSEGNQDEARVEVSAVALAALHPALASRVARLALAVLAPDRFVGFEHVERLLELARADDHRGAVSLPGQHVVRHGDRLIFTRQPFRAFSNSFHVSLSIPGEVVLEHQGWAVSATGASHLLPEQVPGTFFAKGASHLSAVVQTSRVTLPLAVRSRKQGDRVRPFGLGGRERKLQDVLVDRKVDRETRDSLPLVVDGADKIVWIVGESVAEDFRVTDPSQGVIFLKARRLGGPG